jgi:hypothetical protein
MLEMMRVIVDMKRKHIVTIRAPAHGLMDSDVFLCPVPSDASDGSTSGLSYENGCIVPYGSWTYVD